MNVDIQEKSNWVLSDPLSMRGASGSVPEEASTEVLFTSFQNGTALAPELRQPILVNMSSIASWTAKLGAKWAANLEISVSLGNEVMPCSRRRQ